jgi:acetyl esterase/lipase
MSRPPRRRSVARERSYVGLELEPGLAIQVYDETNPARLGRQDFEEGEAAFLAGLDAQEGDGIIYSVSARRRRDRRHSFASLAPLSLLPYAVETAAGLMVGGLDIITSIDPAALERRFGESGIEAEVARVPEAEHGFLTARRGTASLSVPATVREQISVELMTVDTLVEMVDWTLAQVASRGTGEQPQMIIDYADEPAYWTTYRS